MIDFNLVCSDACKLRLLLFLCNYVLFVNYLRIAPSGEVKRDCIVLHCNVLYTYHE